LPCEINPTMLKKLYLLGLVLTISICNSAYAQLHINEILASNETGLTDQEGEYEDWIEIYNEGSSPINLANYYISDDPDDVLLSQIQNTDAILTTVPAGGYLLLWADKDLDQGANHVNLKLGGSGESLTLTAPDGATLVAELTFPGQSDDISYGRTTDGSNDFSFFSTPSPLAENVADPSNPTTSISLDLQIVDGNDDAEQFPSGYMILGSSDIEMVNDNGSDLTSGFRFQNVLLPANATVTSAYLEFFVDETNDGPTDLNIKAELGTSQIFNSTFSNITDRSLSNTSVNWQPDAWTTLNESGPAQRSPDLSSIVQEVINSGAWTEGGAMTFVINGSGLRTAISYNKNADRAAKLTINADVEINTTPISGVVINEVAPFASDYLDEENKREDWVELFNTTSEIINVGGLYLSDKASSPDKWQIPSGLSIPAGGYLTIFCDSDPEDGPLHADFSFKASGESAVLSQQTATGFETLDRVDFEDIAFESSYARIPNGSGNFVKVGTPTANESNNGSLLYLEPPVVDLSSAIYSGAQTISISHPDNSAIIKYTLDGSDPDQNSDIYSGPISIVENTAVRAIAIKSGYQDSKPANEAYLINESPNMDVIFITTDPDNFFDDEIGIYVDGTNGIQQYCAPYPVNWAQDWERPANFKMFTPDGNLAWDVNAGVEINGVCSRNNAMKSLGINLREKTYGDEAIEYELYPTRNHENYQRLKLRNSGQDFIRLGFRDMLNQQLIIGEVDMDMLEGIPTLVFLNGDFWGIHNLREKFSGEYFEAIYDVKEEDLDVIKSPGIPWQTVKEGTDDIYEALFNFVESADLNDPASIQYFEDNVDVNEFLNYWIFMTYLSNYDWPANNLKVWRERKAGAKWRYGAEDTDGSTQNILGDQAEPEWNTLAAVSDPNSSVWPNHSNSTLFLRKLIERDDYKAEWVQRTCSFIELFFNTENVNQKTDEIKALYEPNIQRHLDKWGDGNALGGDVASWNTWVDFYKDFFATRPALYRQFMQDQYNLSGTYDLTISFDASSGGTVKVNSNEMQLPFNYTGTYMDNLPVKLTAVPNNGYTFQYWLETGDTNPVIDYESNSNVTLTPIFVIGNCTPGSACNDGDACTDGDVFDADCNCEGIFVDDDNDGVCNANDQCPGFDDNLDQNGNGVPDDCETGCTDADNDGICEADDCDDNDASLPAIPGSACDDGNAQTENDTYAADGCLCIGVPISTGTYCDAEGDFPWHEWISKVKFGSIDNTSGKNKYSDFTNLVTAVSSGGNYDIELNTGFSWTTYDENWKIWIDFNGDQVFATSEEIFSGILYAPANGTANAFLNANITLPSFNENGTTTRMRVAMSRAAITDPCATIDFGEVEDYTVVLGGGSPQDRIQFSANEIRTFPVPSDDWVRVELPKSIEATMIKVFAPSGKEMYQEDQFSKWDNNLEINISEWVEGIYFVQVQVESGKWKYGKIIVAGNK